MSVGTSEQLRDLDDLPRLGRAIPLGIQHVRARPEEIDGDSCTAKASKSTICT